MKSIDLFSSYHPIIDFLYFALCIGFTMVFMHPVILVISLLSAFLYGITLNGRKALLFSLKYMIPYSVGTFLMWIVIIIVWYLVAIPLGIGVSPVM